MGRSAATLSTRRAPRGSEAAGAVDDAAQAAGRSRWAEAAARVGYATKGGVYLLIGWLAALTAVGSGGQTTDQRGALLLLDQQPLGRVLVGATAIGLAGYALWKLVCGVADPEARGTGLGCLLVRLGDVVTALSYAGLATVAGRLALGVDGAGSGGGARAQDWTALVMEWPFGRALIVAVGVAFIGNALFQFFAAWKGDFRKRLDLSTLSADARRWVVRLGRGGLAARGVVFTLIGLFLVQAARTRDPGQAIGLGGALQKVAEQPAGLTMLGVVAIGLITFGIFSLAEARYGRRAER